MAPKTPKKSARPLPPVGRFFFCANTRFFGRKRRKRFFRPPVAGRAGTPARSVAARRRAAWRGSKREADEGRFFGE
ncbi:hypothetical protein TR75_04295 [Hydrogenibacillus schlegelii]|uniref:Uncharacterized protein n=1 Tax=Hydrogenibacillus schlegelii TaxID=1484 RepID=A0A132N9Z1_HYDSH|nr:hypothetical protein TR75_04295 [Hydrogenibacillus schlegelii]OAR03306.1 hypothetical protein SA87_03890 [Hydrogenibacillus schlegelii]